MAIPRKTLLAAILAALLLTAQFGVFRNLGSTPRAETQEEFDLYLKIISERDPILGQTLVSGFLGSTESQN